MRHLHTDIPAFLMGEKSTFARFAFIPVPAYDEIARLWSMTCNYDKRAGLSPSRLKKPKFEKEGRDQKKIRKFAKQRN